MLFYVINASHNVLSLCFNSQMRCSVLLLAILLCFIELTSARYPLSSHQESALRRMRRLYGADTAFEDYFLKPVEKRWSVSCQLKHVNQLELIINFWMILNLSHGFLSFLRFMYFMLICSKPYLSINYDII